MKPSKKHVAEILRLLDREYGTDDRCYLYYRADHELLIAVILSAQCKDDYVNRVTPALFERFPTVQAFAEAEVSEIEEMIRSIGLYRDKARNIKACCERLHAVYQDKVPGEMEALLTLPGVGRKTANVILSNIYHKPSIVVDTHVKRISKKLGLTEETDPEKVEYALMQVLPVDHWILWNMQIITLGRTLCDARKPKCGECFLREVCPSAGKAE